MASPPPGDDRTRPRLRPTFYDRERVIEQARADVLRLLRDHRVTADELLGALIADRMEAHPSTCSTCGQERTRLGTMTVVRIHNPAVQAAAYEADRAIEEHRRRQRMLPPDARRGAHLRFELAAHVPPNETPARAELHAIQPLTPNPE